MCPAPRTCAFSSLSISPHLVCRCGSLQSAADWPARSGTWPAACWSPPAEASRPRPPSGSNPKKRCQLQHCGADAAISTCRYAAATSKIFRLRPAGAAAPLLPVHSFGSASAMAPVRQRSSSRPAAGRKADPDSGQRGFHLVRGAELATVSHYNIAPVIDIYGNVVNSDLPAFDKISKRSLLTSQRTAPRLADNGARPGADHERTRSSV